MSVDLTNQIRDEVFTTTDAEDKEIVYMSDVVRFIQDNFISECNEKQKMIDILMRNDNHMISAPVLSIQRKYESTHNDPVRIPQLYVHTLYDAKIEIQMKSIEAAEFVVSNFTEFSV